MEGQPMNQFSNIGSMFPGAEYKVMREQAKQRLTLDGMPMIVGLIIMDQAGTKTFIEKEKVQVIPRELELVVLPKIDYLERAIQIAQVECDYWKKVCDEDPGGYGIEGLAASANIIAALVRGITAEEFKKEKEESKDGRR
jgi:hypothetical protein